MKTLICYYSNTGNTLLVSAYHDLFYCGFPLGCIDKICFFVFNKVDKYNYILLKSVFLNYYFIFNSRLRDDQATKY